MSLTPGSVAPLTEPTQEVRANLAPTPEFWSQSSSPAGGVVLRYAVRGGRSYYGLIALGAVLVLYCGSVAFRWLTEGGLTGAGILFVLLIPGSGLLFGLRCLDVALRARTDYTLGKHALAFRDQSLFGSKMLEVSRQEIVGLSQQYTPPGASAPQSSPGSWTTFVTYREGQSGKKTKDLAIEGMRTPEEAKWLGPILAKWADKPLARGFDASNDDEADPSELPSL